MKYTIVGIFKQHHDRQSDTMRKAIFLRWVEGANAEAVRAAFLKTPDRLCGPKILTVEEGHIAVES